MLLRTTQWNIPMLTRNRLPTFIHVLSFLAGILIGFNILAFIRPPEDRPLPHLESSNERPVLALTEDLSVDALRDMVAQSKGYWARDYSLHLGWNNVSATDLMLSRTLHLFPSL
jgi:hypothetical protein